MPCWRSQNFQGCSVFLVFSWALRVKFVGALTRTSKSGERRIFASLQTLLFKIRKPFGPRSRYHPTRRVASVLFVNFPFFAMAIKFWRKSHTKWTKLTFISLITFDQGIKLRVFRNLSKLLSLL